jgi:hypothetical protein
MVLDEFLEGLSVSSLLPASLYLIKVVLIERRSYICEGKDERFKVHAIQSSNL